MFIRAAQQFRAAALLLIPLLAVALWWPGFILPYTPKAQVPMPLFGLIEQFIADYPLPSRIIALALVLGEAFLLNYTIIEHNVLTKKSYLPALFYVTLTGCSLGLLRLHPALIANLFLLQALRLLFEGYRTDTAYAKSFNAGLLIALASLIYLPAGVFVLFAMTAFIILRPFVWREWIILICGILLPYCYAAAYYFWFDRSHEFWYGAVIDPIRHKDFFLALPKTAYLLTAMIGVLLLSAAARFVTGAGTATLKTKKGVSVVIWLLIFALASLVVTQDFGVAGLVPAALPLSVLVSNAFLHAKRIWIMEVIFLFVLAGIAVAYWPYFKS